MSEFVEELRRIVWYAYHAKDYTPYYKWGSFEEVIPMYITHPLKHWYIWGLMTFGLLCAIYIPYFWIVYTLLLGLLLLTTICVIFIQSPHSLCGMMKRIYRVDYKDGTTHFVRMEIPRYACQSKKDPYGVYLYTMPELRHNRKIKFWTEVDPYEFSRYHH